MKGRTRDNQRNLELAMIARIKSDTPFICHLISRTPCISRSDNTSSSFTILHPPVYYPDKIIISGDRSASEDNSHGISRNLFNERTDKDIQKGPL